MKYMLAKGNSNTQIIGRKTLALSVALFMQLSASAYALETMSDDTMRDVSGQDGIAITASMDEASIDNITWQDGDQGSISFGTDKDATAKTPITLKPTTGNTSVNTTISLETGTNGLGAAGLSATLGLGAVDVDIPTLSICDKDGNNCNKLGALAVSNRGTATQFSLVTTNGLFNEQGTAQLKAVLDNFSVDLKQKNGGQTNLLKFGDMYANITADGKLFVTDADGLKFIGTMSFDKKTLSNAERDGLELLVQHQSGATGAELKTIAKLALTGKLTDVDLSVRGVKGTVTGLGFDNGSNGIAMRMSANFDKDMTLKVGNKAGIGLTGWKNIADAKSFDSGNVYVNVMPSSAATSQTLKTNARLTITDEQFKSIETNADYLSRNFKKEVGDANVSPFGTAGKRYLTDRQGNVIDSNGNTVNVFHGLTSDANKGLVTKDGTYLSARSFLSDGYIVDGPTYTIRGDGNRPQGNNNSGQFRTVFSIDKNGNVAPLYLTSISDESYPNGSVANGEKRPNRQVRVWVGNTRNGVPTNVVVAPYGAGSGDSGRQGDPNRSADTFQNRGNHSDAYHKAIILSDGQYRFVGGNDLRDLDTANTFYFYVNENGEIHDLNDQVFLQRHKFNEQGFLVVNEKGGSTGNNSDNGEYVYQYAYKIDEATNELVISEKKTGNEVQRVKLAVLTKASFDLAKDEDYNITTEAVSGDGGTTSPKQSVSVNIRNMSVQGYATKTEFFDKTQNKTQTQNWAVAPVLYGVNANLMLSPKKLSADNTVTGYTQAGDAIGYKLAATTIGAATVDANGNVTVLTDFQSAGANRTSGLLVTHANKDNTETRYVGLRHMDSLVRAQGDIQITGEGIAITANDFLFAFRAELAAGKMPNASQTFNTTDTLAVAQGRLKGDLYAKVLPTNDAIGFDATLKLAKDGFYGTNSGVRLSMPDGKSSINMAEITGTIQAKGTLDTADIDPSNGGYKGALVAKMTTTLNPTNDAENDVRIKHLGINTRPIAGNVGNFDIHQDVKLGQMAFGQNKIYSEVTIGQ